jgi:hypothetical protein
MEEHKLFYKYSKIIYVPHFIIWIWAAAAADDVCGGAGEISWNMKLDNCNYILQLSYSYVDRREGNLSVLFKAVNGMQLFRYKLLQRAWQLIILIYIYIYLFMTAYFL